MAKLSKKAIHYGRTDGLTLIIEKLRFKKGKREVEESNIEKERGQEKGKRKKNGELIRNYQIQDIKSKKKEKKYLL